MPDSGLHIERDENRIRIEGALDLEHFQQAKAYLKKTHASRGHITAIDVSKVTRLDTSGALLLRSMADQHVKVEHLSAEHEALFELISKIKIHTPSLRKPKSSWMQMVERLGKAAIDVKRTAVEFITFMGQACLALASAFRHPSRLRFSSITHHIEAIGINAIPIISLIAFVMSVVIAYQGQVQLRALGAQEYTVDMIAISVLREMGVLLTAIMIAGRSGSAFTAEIGTMEVREEVDALRSIGFDPFELLVLPRLIALMIALPLLALLADMMGLFGGAIISMSLIDMSVPEYIERVRHAAKWQDFFVGLIKAPVFAFVIALVGCRHGLKVSGSSESVGKETTASVVESIFLVLLLDGMFSIYFQKVGL